MPRVELHSPEWKTFLVLPIAQLLPQQSRQVRQLLELLVDAINHLGLAPIEEKHIHTQERTATSTTARNTFTHDCTSV